MGSSFTAKCERCDLEAYGSIGGGMSDFKTFSAWPCFCRSCNNITTANTLAEPLVCLECKSTEVTIYDDSLSIEGPPNRRESSVSWGSRRLDTTRSYLCPHCASFAVVFRHGGMSWD